MEYASINFKKSERSPHTVSPWLYDAFPYRPIFLVLIYLNSSTMTFVIRIFLCPMCHIIEVTNVHTWWGPTLRIGPWDPGVAPRTKWIHRHVIKTLLFVSLHKLLVYRGFHFIVMQAHRSGLQWRIHPQASSKPWARPTPLCSSWEKM